MRTRVRAGDYAVYLHYLPGSASAFHVGFGRLDRGHPYQFGAIRGIRWHHHVAISGFRPEDVMVELKDVHRTEDAAAAARDRLAAKLPGLIAKMPKRRQPISPLEASQIFQGLKAS
ncbi:MAG: hypothetical protein AAF713_18680 [Pseudomonadota bacterium]